MDVPWDHATKVGVGPGEERLAVMWDGVTCGARRSYDVFVPRDQTRWEVKYPSANGEVRLEQKGIAVLRPSLEVLRGVVDRLQRILRSSDRRLFLEWWFDEECLRSIESFVDTVDRFGRTQAEHVLRGEFSTGRAIKLWCLLRMINAQLGEGASRRFESIRDDRRQIAVTVSAVSLFTDVFSALDVAASLRVDPTEAFEADELMKLQHALVGDDRDGSLSEAFERPHVFASRWQASLKPSDVFDDVDGVVLVRPDSYRVIPRDRVDDVFRFCRVSKGKPYVKVKSR